MSEIVTPDMIVDELRAVQVQANRGPDALFAAEMNFNQSEAKWQKAYDMAFTLSEGTVAANEIAGREASVDERFLMKTAKAEWTRVKAKIDGIERSVSNLQTQAKLVLITYGGPGS
jgi:hypothetical protein